MEQSQGRVENDVAYLAKLSSEVLELSTPFGRQLMALAANDDGGRATLQSMLVDYRRWHEALVHAADAIATAHADVQSALDGESVVDRAIH